MDETRTRRSINLSLESKLLESVNSLSIGMDCVGLLECAAAGALKEEQYTGVQIRVYDLRQIHETMGMFSVTGEIRMMVEQAESANGELFAAAHEKIALWIESVMLGDGCAALGTADADVDGFQLTNGEMDFDSASGVWYAVWRVTLSGRIKNT